MIDRHQHLQGRAARLAAGWTVLLAAVVWSAVAPGRFPGETVAAQRKTAAPAAGAVYQDVYNGYKWWHVYCYRCHGQNALGGVLAPNLISASKKHTSAEFLKIVRTGREDKGMQGWSKLLTNKQIGQIHLYVRARADKVLPAGRPDEVGPKGGHWVPPAGWPGQ